MMKTTNLRFSRLLLLAGIVIILVTSCGPKRNVYTGPPKRTIPLDSVKTEIDPYRIKPPVDSFLVEFMVPGDSDCPVKIDFMTSQHKIKRKIADSVFSAGLHQMYWPRIDSKLMDTIKIYTAYYYVFTICDSSYTKSFYYRPEPY